MWLCISASVSFMANLLKVPHSSKIMLSGSGWASSLKLLFKVACAVLASSRVLCLLQSIERFPSESIMA